MKIGDEVWWFEVTPDEICLDLKGLSLEKNIIRKTEKHRADLFIYTVNGYGLTEGTCYASKQEAIDELKKRVQEMEKEDDK